VTTSGQFGPGELGCGRLKASREKKISGTRGWIETGSKEREGGQLDEGGGLDVE